MHTIFSFRLSVSLLAGFAAVISSGCEPGEPARPRELVSGAYSGFNVVFLSVDTLRVDRLGLYGYGRDTSPNLDRVAQQSVVFDRAHVPRGLTWPSLASMFTGLYPQSTNVRRNGDLLADSTPTLMTILHERGYTTAAFLANACKAFERGLDQKVCGTDGKTAARAVDWIENSPEAPFFLWVHFEAPHETYKPQEAYDIFTDPGYGGKAAGSREFLDNVILSQEALPEVDHAQVSALYDGEVLFADALMGRVLQALAQTGLLESSIVVLVSDHGEELADHNNYYYHACSTYESVLHVPLMIRFPDRELAGLRIPQIVENLDLTPTLLDLLGIDIELALQGRSLLPLLNRNPEGAEAFDHSLAEYYRPGVGWIRSIRTDRWRYIYNPEKIVPTCRPEGSYFRVAREELYDHSNDPRELRNVADQFPEVVAELRKELLAAMGADPEQPPPIRAGPEVIEQLKALGYLGD